MEPKLLQLEAWWAPYHGSHARDEGLGGGGLFSSQDRHSSAVVFGGWILDQTQVTLWDIDLNHQLSSRLHDHVKSLRVGDLSQGHVGCKQWHVSMCFWEVVKAHHDEPPGLPSSIPFQAAAWGRSTPQGHLSPALPHWHLLVGEMLTKIDATGVVDGLEPPHPCWPPPSVASASPWASWVDVMVDLKASFQLSTKRSLNVIHYGIKLVPVGLGFCWILWSRVGEVHHHQGLLMAAGCFDAMSLFWNSPEEGSHTRVATSKTRQIMMFLVGTSAYIGSMTLNLLADPWSVFLHQTNHHPAFTISDWFLSMVGGS